MKIYEKFESSKVTGKWDYQLLHNDKDGNFFVENGVFRVVSYVGGNRISET